MSLLLRFAENEFDGRPQKTTVSAKVSSLLKCSSFKVGIFSASSPSFSFIYCKPFTSKPRFWSFEPRFHYETTMENMKNLLFPAQEKINKKLWKLKS